MYPAVDLLGASLLDAVGLGEPFVNDPPRGSSTLEILCWICEGNVG